MRRSIDGLSAIVSSNFSLFPFQSSLFLFCSRRWGARTSAVRYSIVETAKANDLNPRKYLENVLSGLSNEEYPGRKETLERYMPWNPEVQAYCK